MLCLNQWCYESAVLQSGGWLLSAPVTAEGQGAAVPAALAACTANGSGASASHHSVCLVPALLPPGCHPQARVWLLIRACLLLDNPS